MDNKVYIVQCEDYTDSDNKIKSLIDLMGGMGRFAKQGEKIVLKVNLLREARPEAAVCTHPAVAAAVGALVKKEGADAVIADSPGGGYRYNGKTLDKIYRTSGMHRAAQQAKIELNRDTTSRPASYVDGILTKHFDIITPVYEASAVFNLCKMKTHLFTMMTGAVKNIFGVVPGLSKPGYHAKLHDPKRFAGMLLDLAQYISPRLSVMDAIVAMEGNGPGTGDPRQVGLLIGSESPLALDVVAGEIMGIDRKQNSIIMEAEQRGLHPNRIEDIEVIGADLSEVKVPDFKQPRVAPGNFGLDPMPWHQQIIQPFFKNAYTVRPKVIWDRCIACGTCIEGCPMEAISFVNEKAFIEDDKCIRCYCCHELCPEEAIGLHSSWLYQLLKPT
ncbi:Iron-sulfur cluster-binding protein [Olavius sp. associated proteobacterium Delta 1]|nr:Iron-sulfur cluster-binding protein [Olavius sp. associated proteobacterium Delta 1]